MSSFIVKSLLLLFVAGIIILNLSDEKFVAFSKSISGYTGIEQTTVAEFFMKSDQYIKEKIKSQTKDSMEG